MAGAGGEANGGEGEGDGSKAAEASAVAELGVGVVTGGSEGAVGATVEAVVGTEGEVGHGGCDLDGGGAVGGGAVA